MAAAATPTIRLGLRANWPQFALLVLVNAFVGGMVGLERSVLPLLESGALKVPVAEAFPLHRAADAYDRFRAGGKLGKIVLRM